MVFRHGECIKPVFKSIRAIFAAELGGFIQFISCDFIEFYLLHLEQFKVLQVFCVWKVHQWFQVGKFKMKLRPTYNKRFLCNEFGFLIFLSWSGQSVLSWSSADYSYGHGFTWSKCNWSKCNSGGLVPVRGHQEVLGCVLEVVGVVLEGIGGR